MGEALAGVGVETVLRRVENAKRRVGLDQPANGFKPAFERVGDGDMCRGLSL